MKHIKVDGEIMEVSVGPWRYETKSLKRSGYGPFVKFDVDFDRELWNRNCGVDQLEAFGYTVEKLEES